MPAIGFILGPIISVVSIFVALGMASDMPSRYEGIFALNLLVDIGLTAFLIFVAVKFFGKKRSAPKLIIALIITNLCVSGLMLAINLNADAEPFAIEHGKGLVTGIISSAIWIPYFLISNRVKRTFIVP